MIDQTVRETFAELAEHARVYDVVEVPVRRARRRRTFRRTALPIAAVVGVVALIQFAAWVPSLSSRVLQPATTNSTSVLPGHLAVPWRWTPTVAESAPGPAVIVFTPPAPEHDGTSLAQVLGRTAVHTEDASVWASSGVYRRLDSGCSLLAPNGSQVFCSGSQGLTIVDLVSGRAHVLPTLSGHESEVVHGLAWSPDSRTVVIGASNADEHTVRLVDAASGTDSVLPAPGDGPATAAAFSPDGNRIAVQRGATMFILDRDGRMQAKVQLAERERIAGPAAWTPDGSAVAMTLENEGNGHYTNPGTSELWLRDASTGTRRTGSPFPTVTGNLRAVGWNGDSPICISDLWYEESSANWSSGSYIRHRTEVVSLLPGAGNAEVLTSAPVGAEVLDVARSAVSLKASTETATPALWPLSAPWLIGCALILSTIGAIIAGLARRKRRIAARTEFGHPTDAAN